MLYTQIISKEEINKGWSGDKKFCARTANGEKYLLRITAASKGEKCRNMFRMQKAVSELGVPMCQPIEIGECDEGIYTIQSFIDGSDAEEAIILLSKEEQCEYGIDAGRMLKLIHSIPAPADQPDWEVRFNAKIDRKIKMYAECPIKFEGAEYMLDYLTKNRHLLKDRPQSYQHGDYHIGNMMIEHSTKRLVVIDFDRYDFGDPWEEFNRIVWCAQKAPAFASGIVNGYFDKDVPIEFWRLLALYISSNMLSSIPWAIPFGEGEINTMLCQAKEVLGWYDNMKNVIPTWYEKR